MGKGGGGSGGGGSGCWPPTDEAARWVGSHAGHGQRVPRPEDLAAAVVGDEAVGRFPDAPDLAARAGLESSLEGRWARKAPRRTSFSSRAAITRVLCAKASL